MSPKNAEPGSPLGERMQTQAKKMVIEILDAGVIDPASILGALLKDLPTERGRCACIGDCGCKAACPCFGSC